MERMPFQPHAGRRAHDRPWRRGPRPDGGEAHDDHGLEARSAGSSGAARHAARAAALRRGVAARSPDHRGSGTVHLAAADHPSRGSRSSSPGRTASAKPGSMSASRWCRPAPPSPSASSRCGHSTRASTWRSGGSSSARPSGAVACSPTVRGRCSRLPSRPSACIDSKRRAVVENGRGNGALRKIGAVREGTLRQSFRKDGRPLDQHLWAILACDWRAAGTVPEIRPNTQLTIDAPEVAMTIH